MMLRPDRPCVTCPPGDPGAANGTPHVVVAAQMRSGTHLLIDLILNNFPVYRENPLYLDLERYRLSDLETSQIPDLRGLVIKTHYPHSSDRVEAAQDIEPLTRRYPVVMPVRDRDERVRSMRRFGDWGAAQSMDPHIDAFERYWSDVPKLTLPFRKLLDPEALPEVVHALEQHLGTPAIASPVGPRPVAQRRRILLDKTLTRLLGAHAPRINTTIGFAR